MARKSVVGGSTKSVRRRTKNSVRTSTRVRPKPSSLDVNTARIKQIVHKLSEVNDLLNDPSVLVSPNKQTRLARDALKLLVDNALTAARNIMDIVRKFEPDMIDQFDHWQLDGDHTKENN